jgi:hypothetical protein
MALAALSIVIATYRVAKAGSLTSNLNLVSNDGGIKCNHLKEVLGMKAAS